MTIPIQRRKISEQVLEEIKALIKNGTFKPDEKLPSEMELAKMFQVSRSPVREAISVLAATGMVESRQGGGNWVRKVEFAEMLEQVTIELVDIKQVYELLELRTIIESEAAALAAKRHDQKDIIELEEALHVLGENMLNNRGSIGDAEDFKFHKTIVRASKNPFLVQTIENISDLYQKALKFSLKQNVAYEKRESVFHEHQAIFEAIKNRDSEAAAENMKKHLRTARMKLGDTLLQDK
ncbi:FadR/GntR family transcriptional regulator [Halalkalibacter nanhaiisediminis]|uniref:GntR family transcriptional repressor for pyruvate dehydrogenase complex n=1 Tax=Halalkalibacter nanhaiisediminis TaxID=688079 RepID=A0A562QN25_9BACI|nr:FadR/GntR family transcriptional regulator [Halalkalibacter nanhaiisediminis]TWI58073.1 GntR family transcriptional repressor for pyruvate dehydrogenase complex [Halalkalibacter nanhaiisediminis]